MLPRRAREPARVGRPHVARLLLRLALPALRGVVWWALVAPVVVAGAAPVAGALGAAAPGSDRGGSGAEPRRGRVLLLASSRLCRGGGPRLRTDRRCSLEAPEGLVRAAAAAPAAGHALFVSQPWGVVVRVRRSRSIPVFVDSRIEIFPDRRVGRLLDVCDGHGAGGRRSSTVGTSTPSWSGGRSQGCWRADREATRAGGRSYRDDDGERLYVRGS